MSNSIQNIPSSSVGQAGLLGSSSVGDVFGGGSSLDMPQNSDLDDFNDLSAVSYGSKAKEGAVSDKVDDAVASVLRDIGSQLSPTQVNELRDLLTTAAKSAFS